MRPTSILGRSPNKLTSPTSAASRASKSPASPPQSTALIRPRASWPASSEQSTRRLCFADLSSTSSCSCSRACSSCHGSEHETSTWASVREEYPRLPWSIDERIRGVQTSASLSRALRTSSTISTRSTSTWTSDRQSTSSSRISTSPRCQTSAISAAVSRPATNSRLRTSWRRRGSVPKCLTSPSLRRYLPFPPPTSRH